jgi:hypothetical protein
VPHLSLRIFHNLRKLAPLTVLLAVWSAVSVQAEENAYGVDPAKHYTPQQLSREPLKAHNKVRREGHNILLDADSFPRQPGKLVGEVVATGKAEGLSAKVKLSTGAHSIRLDALDQPLMIDSVLLGAADD